MPSVTELDARTIGDVVALFATGSTPKGYVRTYANGRVNPAVGRRECDSYGSHFPLFRWVPRELGGPLWIINGDRWRGPQSRTNDHQAAARSAIAETGLPSIILPFSALQGAGIDIDSVRVLDVRADANWTESHALPDGAPNLDDLSSADRCLESDERSTVDYRGNPCASHGCWDRRYVWCRGSHEYTRRIYRQAHSYAGDPPGWRYSDSWDTPVSEHSYMDGHELERGAEGWTYTTHHHRLGDALFTAVREVREPLRPAYPFESERESRTETVRLIGTTNLDTYCTACGAVHEAGPSGACIHCGETLRADVTYRRRARYLSSFDYNERQPLYFLCEVSRKAAPTVEAAIDSLAPRAVHAATLAGKTVERQGDVFFIPTPLDRETLLDRGAVFGRLTQWTRDAKPRPGEITYRVTDPAVTKRKAMREARLRHELWRKIWSGALEQATVAHIPDTERRAANRARWDMFHELDGNPKSADGYRLARETGEHSRTVALPSTPAGSRRRWAKLRAKHASDLERARDDMRRAILGARFPAYHSAGGPTWKEGQVQYRRRTHRQAVQAARGNLSRASAPVTDSNGHTHARHARDNYRARYGSNAIGAWNRASLQAQSTVRPETIDATDQYRHNHQAVRRHLMIYGTSHTATEVARVGSAVYVRGTVRHAVDLEENRGGGPDHRPLALKPDVWYLAVRNTVPRQNRRRRRRNGTGTVSR